MKVCKFGGTSLSTAVQVRKACDIVQADPGRRFVVVSAPGRSDSGDVKVTDLLIAAAERRLAGETAETEVQRVVDRFRAIQKDLGLPDELGDGIAEDLRVRLQAETSHRERFIDAVKAAGEDNCARLVAAELARRGAPARYVNPGAAGLLLSSEYGNARILPESYDNLAALRGAEGITVFPGFFGYTREGDVVTFPRGGSDITGSVLAAAVRADEYENFTDVDSVCAVDPAVAPGVAPIRELTYREMRELSYAGFRVLHDEAILPAVHARIPIRILNTNRPELPGTKIVAERRAEHGQPVGIAGHDGFCSVFVGKYLMNREIGFGRRFLQIFEEEGVSFEHMPSGMDNVSIILREADIDANVEQRILRRIRKELDADSVDIERGLALVMLVGEGMRFTVGLAARACVALAEAGINIEMINQGSSEISMMFGVKSAACHAAMRALYEEFFARGDGKAGTRL